MYSKPSIAMSDHHPLQTPKNNTFPWRGVDGQATRRDHRVAAAEVAGDVGFHVPRVADHLLLGKFQTKNMGKSATNGGFHGALSMNLCVVGRTSVNVLEVS